MNNQSLRMQWMQLLVLSGLHFLVDLFGNMLPAILPEIRQRFALSLSVGSFVLASLMLTANGMQMVTGHLRPDKTRPLFLHVGLLLSASICLLALAPTSTTGVLMVIGLGIISGCGIAVTHPEGLRGVHALDKIPAGMGTAVFMTAGFLGFASGGAVSSRLVDAFGLKGLYPLVLCVLVGVLAVLLARIRLAAERTEHETAQEPSPPGPQALPFWQVMAIGLPAAISTTVIIFLIPTHLDELGFDLKFRGLSTAMFGWGGTIGPFIWALGARKKGDLPCAFWSFFLSVPFIILYFVFVKSHAAIWMLFGTGFCSMSAYILTITLARHATGLNLGHRMAFIVGGNWGIANVVFLLFAPVAERLGTGFVLRLMPLGYVLSTLLAWRLMRAYPGAGRPSLEAKIIDVVAEDHTPV